MLLTEENLLFLELEEEKNGNFFQKVTPEMDNI
jgi:hypothetical protein